MNKLYIVLVLLLAITTTQAQTNMNVHLINGDVESYLVSNVDSVTFDTITGMGTCPALFTDARDGEIYKAVRIGNQCWMKENLRYNHTGSLLNPNNPTPKYGRLYTWDMVMNGAGSSTSNPSGVQGLCPNGWHVPSESEWFELEMAVGLDAQSVNTLGYRGCHAPYLKSGTGWINGGNGIDVDSPIFNALPAGKNTLGGYFYLSETTGYWVTNESSAANAWYYALVFNYSGVFRDEFEKFNFISCRCVKD